MPNEFFWENSKLIMIEFVRQEAEKVSVSFDDLSLLQSYKGERKENHERCRPEPFKKHTGHFKYNIPPPNCLQIYVYVQKACTIKQFIWSDSNSLITENGSNTPPFIITLRQYQCI